MWIGMIIGILIGALFNAIIIWLVGRFGLGIEVDGFGPAFIAAIIIAVLGAVANWLWDAIGYTSGDGVSGAIISLILAAGFLQFAGNAVSGLRVKGFTGALIGALAISLVTYLISLLLSGMLPS